MLCIMAYLTVKILTIVTLDGSSKNVQEVVQQQPPQRRLPPINVTCHPMNVLGLPQYLINLNCTDCKEFECHRFLFPETGKIIFNFF